MSLGRKREEDGRPSVAEPRMPVEELAELSPEDREQELDTWNAWEISALLEPNGLTRQHLRGAGRPLSQCRNRSVELL
jgi:hypothetical protein